MKIFKFSALCAAALSLCAAASAQVTDYTPISANLTATYTQHGIPYATGINNATLLKKIGIYLDINVTGASLQIDNTTGDVVVLSSAGSLLANLTTGLPSTTNNMSMDAGGTHYLVTATAGGIVNNNAFEITSGTSTHPADPAANFSIKGSFATRNGIFTITFSDDFPFNDGDVNAEDYTTDYQVNITHGSGTFANSLVVTAGVNAYKQSFTALVFGTALDNELNDNANNLQINPLQWNGIVSGTISASGKSAVVAPSIWDVITPVPAGP